VLGVCVRVSVCVSAEPRLQARRISLRGEGHALYPVLSSCFVAFERRTKVGDFFDIRDLTV